MTVTSVVAVGAGEATAAIQCGKTLTHDVKLHKDLKNCPGHGLVIGAPDITVDLNGHRIDAVGNSVASGVFNTTGHDDVVVKGGGGGRITGFGRGAEMGITSGSTIKGIEFRGTSLGVFIHGSSDMVVDNNEITDVAQDEAIGVVIQGTPEARVTDNTIGPISGEETAAIHVSSGSDEALVHANLIRRSDGPGVLVEDSDATRIKANTVRRGKGRGIEIAGDSDATRVKGNKLTRLEDGILLLGSMTGTGTQILDNVARQSKEDGIEVDVTSALLGDNLVVDNTDWGIEAEAGVTDLGGNKAAGNGEPGQCLNVVCTAP